MNQKGFTLIELMIVVTIIGILVAVGIPQYQNYVARAQAAEGLSLLSGTKTAVAEYVMANGSFPESNSDAGLSDATTISGQYVKSVAVTKDGDEGVITATFNTGINENVEDKIMMLTASSAGGSVTFECTTTVYESYAPKDCTSVPVISTATLPGLTLASSASGTTANVRVAWTSDSGEDACWDNSFDGGNGGWVVGNCNDCRQNRMQETIRQKITEGKVYTPKSTHEYAGSSCKSSSATGSPSGITQNGRVAWIPYRDEEACWDNTFDGGKGGWVVGSCKNCRQNRMQETIRQKIIEGKVYTPRNTNEDAGTSCK